MFQLLTGISYSNTKQDLLETRLISFSGDKIQSPSIILLYRLCNYSVLQIGVIKLIVCLQLFQRLLQTCTKALFSSSLYTKRALSRSVRGTGGHLARPFLMAIYHLKTCERAHWFGTGGNGRFAYSDVCQKVGEENNCRTFPSGLAYYFKMSPKPLFLYVHVVFHIPLLTTRKVSTGRTHKK